MCPCPFCTAIALILAPLLLFKPTRTWLKKKVKRHHCHCDTCQQAEHQAHVADKTPCTCVACKANKKKSNVKKGKQK